MDTEWNRILLHQWQWHWEHQLRPTWCCTSTAS